MKKKEYEDIDNVFWCKKDNVRIPGVIIPPAQCPICGRSVFDRPPDYYQVKKEHLESLPMQEGHVDYTKFSQDIILNVKTVEYKNGTFIRTCQWNITKIIGQSSVKSGFIVQHITRRTVDSKNQYIDKTEYNHEYWEAWPVKNAQITLPGYDKKCGVDDTWSTFERDWNWTALNYKNTWMKEILTERKDSYGEIAMTGIVYWAPVGSELEEIVKNTFHEKIPMAGNLPAAWNVNGYERFIPVDKEIPYHHSWDLTNDEKYHQALNEIDTEFSI